MLDEFAKEIRDLFDKYVESASVIEISLKDGSEVGMKRLILYAFHKLKHIDSQMD